MKNIQPKLSLIGAGPGDPELITIKAVKILQLADIVLYDALVNTALLEHVPPQAKIMYVGKRLNKHSLSQNEINALIVSSALKHGHVVRLKGGDPFVFGRGSEEIQYAELHNIPAAYVPGISSAISVPALAGIPVTHRGLSESFWVITGTTKSGKISKDVFEAVKTDATVVILMGLSKLNEIVAAFKKQGRHRLPAAVIQDGSLPTQKIVLGNVSDIEKKVIENQISAPAILIFGEVVKQHAAYHQEQEISTLKRLLQTLIPN